ncbi:MAG: hypothetical protein IJI05_03465 [Erysipelotrichaceae bacterium]|nr:hypothetical protein [Erysipelotrichaceae bacterium]
MRRTLSIVFNALILIVTIVVMTRYFKPGNGKSAMQRGLSSFRYFTIDSNVFSAFVSAIYLVFITSGKAIPQWLMVLKFVAAVTVMLTCLTVMLYLGPTYGYKNQLSDVNIHMHLMGPLMAVITTCFFENDMKLKIWQMLLGLIPTAIYGLEYIFMVSKHKKWEDFYGFAKSNMTLSGTLMMILTSIICVLMGFIYNH